MWPEAHHIGGLQFTFYDVMRGVAIAAASTLCVLLNRRQNISARTTLLIAAVSAPLAIASARLLNAVEYGADWTNLVAEFVRNSGSSVYGALMACAGTIVAMTYLLGISTLRFFDAGAPAIAVGEALSRVGCFCAGCCYGTPWKGPWAVVFPPASFAAIDQRSRGLLGSTMTDSIPVHPVQIYAVILMSLLTWGLLRRFRTPHHEGVVFFWLLIGYGLYRLAIAQFRMEALASMKLFSLVFIGCGVLGLLWARHARTSALVQ
jgi:phosphatidylglycerol---prolipoprotein diacylglyceryl transferase